MKKDQLLLEQWKIASELNRHEDNLTWNKFYYLVSINGILVTVLATLYSYSHIDIYVKLVISFMGILVSFILTYIIRRGKFYQSYRIAQAREIENALIKSKIKIYEYGMNDFYNTDSEDKERKEGILKDLKMNNKLPKYLGIKSTHGTIIIFGMGIIVIWICYFFVSLYSYFIGPIF